MARFCISCGTQMPDNSVACPACGKVLPPDIGAAAAASPKMAPEVATDQRPAPEQRLARLGDRLLATILDSLLLGAFFSLVGMWSAVRWGGVTPNGFSISGKPAIFAMSIAAVVGFLYYWLLEGLAGATLGKAIVGIRVRSQDGSRCSFHAALLRNLLRIVDGLFVYLVGFLIAVFSKRRQRLGDRVAQTIVLEQPSGVFGRSVFTSIWLAGLAGALFGVYWLHHGAPISVTQSAPTAGQVNPTPGSTSAGVSRNSVTASSSTSAPDQPLALTSGDFKLVNFVWTQGADGPARPSGPYRAGDDVFAKYDLTGFTTDPQGQINVNLSVTAFDPNGLALDKAWTSPVQGKLANAATPINASFHVHLPPFVPSGTYKMVIKTHDAVKNADAEFDPTFTVDAGPPIPPASQLEVRNFQFSTAANGTPISPAVYHAGDTVYYAFDLFGVQFQNDRMSFHTALKVIGPDGKTIFENPDLLNSEDTLLYHPGSFFLPVHGNLNLPSGSPGGTYKEQFIVTDRQANTSLNHEETFALKP